MFRKAGVFAVVVVLWAPGAARGEEGAAVTKPAAPPWKGSEISVSHYGTLTSFDRSALPDYNPMFGQAISLDPRWKLNDKLSFKGHLGVDTELTDSDDTVREREPLLDDLSVSASHKLPALPQAIKGSVSLAWALSTSQASRALHRWSALTGGVSANRTFELKPGIELTVNAGLRVGVGLATEQSVTYDGPRILFRDFETESLNESTYSGVRSSRTALSQSVGADLSLPHDLSASIGIGWRQANLYPLAEATNSANDMDIPERDTNTDWRYSNSYDLGLSWQATDRFTVSGGFQTMNPQQKPNSTYYRPFFNLYTQAYVTTAVVF
jgi:hypothetical protein